MPHNLTPERAQRGDRPQGGDRGHVWAGGWSPVTVGPLREVTDSLTPGQGVPGPTTWARAHVRSDGSHGQVRGGLDLVLGRDVDMMRGEALHHWPGAGPHQPGHVRGALVPVRLEGVPPVSREDVSGWRDVLITDC